MVSSTDEMPVTCVFPLQVPKRLSPPFPLSLFLKYRFGTQNPEQLEFYGRVSPLSLSFSSSPLSTPRPKFPCSSQVFRFVTENRKENSFTVARINRKFDCCPNNYTILELSLTVQRKPLYYLINLVTPTSIITFISIVGFFRFVLISFHVQYSFPVPHR